jgi:hypothetical protein
MHSHAYMCMYPCTQIKTDFTCDLCIYPCMNVGINICMHTYILNALIKVCAFIHVLKSELTCSKPPHTFMYACVHVYSCAVMHAYIHVRKSELTCSKSTLMSSPAHTKSDFMYGHACMYVHISMYANRTYSQQATTYVQLS